MGCNSSNQVGSTPPNANLPSKQPQTEAEAKVDSAKAAFEAALEEADEDQDKVVALAVEYAIALQKSPGELPPEGFYTSEESIFEALMPLGDGGIAPVKLLKTEWIKKRAAKIKAATTDDERRKLRLPRRQDLERDEPEAFMSVERLKELKRGEKVGGSKLAAAASSYCWLTPAHPDPLGEQLVSLAEAIEKAEQEKNEYHDGFPSEAAIFIDFGSLCQKDPDMWVPCCGGPTYKPPEARTAEEAAAADAYEASRTGEEREAFGVALSSMQIWYVHPMLTAFLTRTLPEGYESIAGYEEVRHALANSALTHSLPTYSTALFPQRGWPTCESSWVALAKVTTQACWPPIFDVVGSKKYRRPAPLSPAAMARLVARKRFTSKKGDLPMVIALNTRTILSIFRDMKMVKYLEVGWGDDEAVQLAEVLPLCTSATELNLVGNKISDRGAKALAAAFAEGAMPKLEQLNLYKNQIGDEGAVALAEAVGKGALPELKELYLNDNKLSQTAKDACKAVKAKRSGLNVKV